MPIALICAAPGTGLTRTTQRINEQSGRIVFDVEQRLLQNLTPEQTVTAKSHRFLDASKNPTMASLTAAFPREVVLNMWQLAAREVIAEAKSVPDAVIACHFTLFRHDRTEYYSTNSFLLAELIRAGATVDRIIQLIDDVYDMHAQLTHATGALNSHVRYAGWRKFTRSSTPADAWAKFDGDNGGEDAHIALEARISALNLLVAWRRTESIAAEGVARALDAPFIILGVKHSFQELLNSLGVQQPTRVYISHPISAYRREMNEKIREGQMPGEVNWNSAVAECNELPSLLGVDGNIVSIMPTAIDEMRFWPIEIEAERLTQRDLRLGPRWPLMAAGDALISWTPEREPQTYLSSQHTDLITGESSSVNLTAFAGQLVRYLEGLFYVEIPYRDHLIVANCDAFVVHRPRADRARVSGGVLQEVRHWWDRHRAGASNLRLAIFHTSSDVDGLVAKWTGEASWLKTDGDRLDEVGSSLEIIETAAVAYIGENYDLADDLRACGEVLEGKELSIDQLGGPTHLATALQVAEARHDALRHGVETLVQSELSLSKHVADGAHVFILDNGVRLTRNRAAQLRDFVTGQFADVGKRVTIVGDEESSAFASFLKVPLIARALFGDETSNASIEQSAAFYEKLVATRNTLTLATA